MSDITLPRAVAFEMLNALICGSSIRHKCQHCGEHIGNFYAALYAALAEPEPTVKDSLTVDAKREPVAFAKNGNLFWCGDASQMRGVDIDLYLAPPQPDAIARAVEAEREAICPIVYGLCVSDNNAQEIVNAIRARGSK